MHAQEDLIVIEAKRRVEGGDVRDPEARLEHDVHEVFNVFSCPFAMAGTWRNDAADFIASGKNAIDFFIGEWRFVRRDRMPLGRLEVSGDVLGYPFALEAEFSEAGKLVELSRLGALAVGPRGEELLTISHDGKGKIH